MKKRSGGAGKPAQQTQTVWLLSGYTGEYSDFSKWVVRAYTNEADAIADRDFLQAIANGGSVSDWTRREAVCERLRVHDADAWIDYTGTQYRVDAMELVASAQYAHASAPAPHSPEATPNV